MTVAGKSSNSISRGASVPSSSQQMTFWLLMRLERKAPDPPYAIRWTALYFGKSFAASSPRLPFPSVAFSPILRSGSVVESMRLEVVGPAEPIGMPGFGGVGPT